MLSFIHAGLLTIEGCAQVCYDPVLGVKFSVIGPLFACPEMREWVYRCRLRNEFLTLLKFYQSKISNMYGIMVLLS